MPNRNAEPQAGLSRRQPIAMQKNKNKNKNKNAFQLDTARVSEDSETPHCNFTGEIQQKKKTVSEEEP
eukprot:2300262-Rhodomonas_salina.4